MSEETEKEARSMGWKPKEDFSGDPEKWVDADTFVERGKNIMPILRENISRLTDKLDRLEKEREKDRVIFKDFQEFTSKSEERAYKKAESEYKEKISDLKLKLKQAAMDQDWAKFDTIEQHIDKLEKPEPPTGKPKDGTPPVADPNQDPVFIEWKGRNDWYGADMELTNWADSVGQFVRKMQPSLSGKPFFDEVTKKMHETYPQKFKNQNQDKPPAVEGTGDTPPVRLTGKKSFSDLPPKAKEAYENFKRIMPNFTKEQYLAQYTWE